MIRTLSSVVGLGGFAMAALALQAPLAAPANAQELSQVHMCLMEVEQSRDKANSVKFPANLAMAMLDSAEEACRAQDFGAASDHLSDANRQIYERRFMGGGGTQ